MHSTKSQIFKMFMYFKQHACQNNLCHHQICSINLIIQKIVMILLQRHKSFFFLVYYVLLSDVTQALVLIILFLMENIT